MINILWWIVIGWWWIPTKWVFCKFYKKPWFWIIILIIGIFSLIGEKNNKQDKNINNVNYHTIQQTEIQSTSSKELEEATIDTSSNQPIIEIKPEEIKSTEDNSVSVVKKEIENDYILNNNSTIDTSSNQPIIEIKPEEIKSTENDNSASVVKEIENDYILNNNSMKFHNPSCRHVIKIKSENRMDYHGTKEDVLRMGYSPCKVCNP